jgi:hypothetical protein
LTLFWLPLHQVMDVENPGGLDAIELSNGLRKLVREPARECRGVRWDAGICDHGGLEMRGVLGRQRFLVHVQEIRVPTDRSSGLRRKDRWVSPRRGPGKRGSWLGVEY